VAESKCQLLYGTGTGCRKTHNKLNVNIAGTTLRIRYGSQVSYLGTLFSCLNDS